MIKLAILSTHPIQYNAPLFKLLALDTRIIVKVFYTLGKESSSFTDPGFGKSIAWDIPLLDGYDYKFLTNTAPKPTTGSFRGIINPTLIQEIEAFGATHLLVYGWAFQSHLKAMRYFKDKVKVLFRGDSTLLDEKPGIRAALRHLWLKWVYKHIDIALYVGTNNKRYYLKHGVPEKKLLFAPHAIDNERFNSPEHDLKAKMLRAAFNIQPDNKVILYIGKFEKRKNTQLLIRAFNQVCSPDIIMLLVGNGELEVELKALAEGNPNIKFLPFQNQTIMPVIYRLGDVLVLPSVTETWGLCINEAMSCGLAIIASNKVGGAADLIEHDKNGYIFKSNSLDELTEALNKFVKMPKELIKEKGRFSAMKIKGWSYGHTSDVIRNYINGC